MQANKKINPYAIAAAASLALVGAFLLARSMNSGEGEPVSTTEAPKNAPAAATSKPAGALRYKIPVSDMQPRRGPDDALVTIVEWCDLRGSPCREAEAPINELMKEYDGRLRWVHRSVPDSRKPDEAKRIHQFLRAAYEDGKNSERAWKVREMLLAIPDSQPITDADLRAIADKVGMNFSAVSEQIRESKLVTAIGLDSGFAARFGVAQLPAIYVNGRPAQDVSSPAALKGAMKHLIEEELVNAQQALSRGVERAKLYDALVEPGRWAKDDDPTQRQASASRPLIPGMSVTQAPGKP